MASLTTRVTEAGAWREPGRRARAVSAGALALLLALVGVGVHAKASRAVAPPLYDAMSYYIKAAHFWRAVGSGALPNPLNIEPVVRPPGTILLSAPLGFSADFRPFLFRSIFVPIALAVAALWLVAQERVRTAPGLWLVTGASAAWLALPMFYHFEPTGLHAISVYWGLVDTFFASVAALATSLLVLSVRRTSIAVAVAGALASSLLLVIKPAALVVVPVVLWSWAVELVIAHWPVARRWRREPGFRRYARTGGLAIALIVGLTLLACVGSRYLSRATIQSFAGSQRLLAEMYRDVPLGRIIVPQIHPWFGWHWTLLLAAIAVALVARAAIRASSHRLERDDIRLAAAAAALGAGLAWWIGFAGPSEIRYVSPFVMIFGVVVLPDVLARASRWPSWVQRAGGAILAVPAVLLAALLWVPEPPVSLQRLLGVNLATGQFSEEVHIGNTVDDAARSRNREIWLYALEGDSSSGMVAAVGEYQRLIAPRAPHVRTRGPIDWIRPPLVRRNELIASDYVVFRPIRDAAELARWETAERVEAVDAEWGAIRAWLTRATVPDGFEVLHDGALRLLQIVDVQAADRSFGTLVARHHWRPLFRSANGAPLLVSQADIEHARPAFVPGSAQVPFTDKFTLHGAAVSHADRALEMELFWQNMSADEAGWWVFVHVLDAHGKVLSQSDYPVPGALRPGLLWRDKLVWSEAELRGAVRLGIGIYRPETGMLRADRGGRDWNNTRVLISLPR